MLLNIYRLADAQKDTMRRIFEKFDDNRNIWSIAVSCISILDCLLSLASVSSSPDYVWPQLIERCDGEISLYDDNNVMTHSCVSVLDIKQGRHPMLEQSFCEKYDLKYISDFSTS